MAQRSSALIPRAVLDGRGKDALTVQERELGDRALQHFIDGLGGEESLISALETGTQNPRVDEVLGIMSDPRYAGRSFRWICAQVGITPAEVFAAFRSAKIAGAQIQSIVHVAEGMAPVVKDVMRRAAPYEEACSACGGATTITPEPTPKHPNPSPEPCSTCRATGRLVYAPELERQKLALDLAGLVTKSGGININQNQLNMPAGSGSSVGGGLERLQQLLGDLSAPTADDLPPVMEAEVVETPAEPDEAPGA